MELEVAIVLLIGTIFLGILSYKAFVKYNAAESVKNVTTLQNQQTNLIYEARIKDLANSNRNYIYKIKRMRESYDLDFDDLEFKETDDDEFKLSEIAQSIYPKLPDSIAKLIDKEEFQNAIVKTVEKKPEILNLFLDKFLGKGSTPGSNSNSASKDLILHLCGILF